MSTSVPSSSPNHMNVVTPPISGTATPTSTPPPHPSLKESPQKQQKNTQQQQQQQQYCLRWNNYQNNLTKVFDHLLQNEFFVDVTLTTEGHMMKCHKVVLSACSPYFQRLLAENPSHHPIVILRDISWSDLRHIVQYMYKGEISIGQEELSTVLKAAESLQVRGLVNLGTKSDLGVGHFDDMEISVRSNVSSPVLVAFDADSDESPPAKRKSSSDSHHNSSEGLNINKRRSFTGDNTTESHHRGVSPMKGGLVPRPQSALLMKRPPSPASSPLLPPPPIPSPYSSMKSNNSLGSSPYGSQGMISQAPPALHHPPTPTSRISGGNGLTLDDLSDVKPGIMEMIQEEQRAKLLEASQISQNWMHNASGNPRGSPLPGSSNCYQNQLQNVWQKVWNQNAAMLGNGSGGNPGNSPGGNSSGSGNGSGGGGNGSGLRYHPYRERGPMKSWRPETMAEAIWAVLQEGLSLSQAARKHDIPYPTFVLYANRVHNMLGPSVHDGSPTIGELRPKGRGRPQRILLGNWPEDHVRSVIRAVVFRDGSMPHQYTPPPSSIPNAGGGAGGPHTMEQLAIQGRKSPSLMRSKSIEGNPLAGLPGLDPLLAENLPANVLEAQFKNFYNNHFQQLMASAAHLNPDSMNNRRGSLDSFKNRFDDAEMDEQGEEELEEEEYNDLEEDEERQLKIDERSVVDKSGTTNAGASLNNGSSSSKNTSTKRDLGESIFKLRERTMMQLQRQWQDEEQQQQEEEEGEEQSSSGGFKGKSLALNPEVMLTEVTSKTSQQPKMNYSLQNSSPPPLIKAVSSTATTESSDSSLKYSSSKQNSFNGIGNNNSSNSKTFDENNVNRCITVDP